MTETEKKLYMYVWREFAPDWTDGLAVAIAEDERQARELVIEDAGYEPDDWGPVDVYEIGLPVAFACTGGS